MKKQTYILIGALIVSSFLVTNAFAKKQPILTLFSTKTATETYVVYNDESIPYTGSQEYVETEINVDGYKTLNIYWLFEGNPQQDFYLRLWFEVSDPATGEKYQDPGYSLTGPALGLHSLDVKGSVLKIRVYNNDRIDADDTFSLIVYAQGS